MSINEKYQIRTRMQLIFTS